MIKQWRRDLSLYYENALILPLSSVLCAVFGIGLGIMLVSSEEEWVYIGTIMLVFIMLLLGMLFAGFQFLQEFRMALVMSGTRRDFIVSFALRQLLMYVLNYAVLLLFYHAERLFYQLVYPQYACAFELPVLTDWRFVAAIGVLWIVLPIAVSLLRDRFGKTVTAGLWIVWVLGCASISRWIDPLLSLVASVPAAAWLAAYVTVLAAAVAVIAVLSKKYAVR